MNNLNKKKDSQPGPSNPKRKSSLGLRNWLNGGNAGEVSNDIPSISIPQAMQRSNSNLSSRGADFSQSTRIPRYSSRDPRSSRRSSSQDPPSARRPQQSPMFRSFADTHMQNVGLLVTPVRPTPSRSPSLLSIASSSRGSCIRRQSTKIQFPGLGPKQKDERPINDKIFLANSVSRVQQFMRNAGVHPPKLLPMSNGALILAYNTIINEIDPSLKVDSKDYVVIIPQTLQTLQYPTNLPKSTFSAVGSNTAGKQLIFMLVWLIDSVEALSTVNPDTRLFPMAESSEIEKINKAMMMTLFEAYDAFKNNSGTDVSQEDYDDLFRRQMGDSLDDEHELQAEIEDLKTKLDSLLSDPRRALMEDKVCQLDEAEGHVHQLSQQRAKLKDTVASKRSKIAEEKDAISQLDVDLGRLDDAMSEVQDQIDRQKMKAEERDQIRQECAILRQEAETHAAYLNKLSNIIGKFDIDMAQLRKKVGDITQDLNCIVLEKGLDESLKWTLNPLQSADAQAYLMDMKHRWERAIQKLAKELETRKQALAAENKELALLHEELRKKKEMIMMRTEEMRRMDAEIVSYQLNSHTTEEKLTADIAAEKSACLKLQEMLHKRPKLEDVVNGIKHVLDEKERLKQEHEKFKNLMEKVFFPHLLEFCENYQQRMTEVVTETLAAVHQ